MMARYVVHIYRPRERAAPVAKAYNFDDRDEAERFFRGRHVNAVAAELSEHLGEGRGYRLLKKRG